MSIIEKSVRAAEKNKARKSPQKSGMQSQGNPQINNTHARANWTSKYAKQLLGESTDDPMFISQFKHLKRAIIQSAFGPLAIPDSNIIIITSPLQNAGKTFISMNLAQTLAQERDHKVLLVDTDNVRASLTTALGLRENKGFFDILDNPDLDPEEVIVATDVPSLAVIPTGAKYSDSAEILNSRHAKDLVARLARTDTNQLIIFDAPPLLATPDAPALTDLAGQFLLVVEAGRTKQSELGTALEFFDEDKIVGLILNKAPHMANSLYRGYHYFPVN